MTVGGMGFIPERLLMMMMIPINDEHLVMMMMIPIIYLYSYLLPIILLSSS